MRSVTNLLQGLDGVTKADVSLEAKRAVVDYDAAKVSVAQMKSAIEDAGFEVDA
ncbi:MAG: cation transporter [Burkholderiaceae bacterium]|nr:cation transporter [Burkholderiaceae bacterium]